MTMEYMGNLGSMIGGLAIFVSLLYLAVETRVNTKAIRSAAMHSAATAAADATVELFGDRERANLMLKMMSPEDNSDISAADQLQFSNLAISSFIRFEDMFAQYDQGVVPDKMWQVRKRFARSLIEHPAWKPLWEMWKNSPIFIPEFVEEIEATELVPNAYLGFGGPVPASSN